MRKTTTLKNLILAPELLVMPGAYDVLSAKLIEQAGFKAVQCSGLGLAGSHLGLPDVGILSMREMIERTYQISQAVDVPVMADGDTGFGNAVTVHHVVREFERAGAAGMNLEDQVMPKRCGHLAGKEVIPLDEMLGKIRAAVDARSDADFVINARTDSLATDGVDEAVRRGNAFAEAGATLIFVDGIETADQVRHVINNINAPVTIGLVEGGRTPMFSFAELESLGAARVSCPVTTILAAMQGVRSVLAQLRDNGGPGGYQDDIADFEEYQDFVGLKAVRELEDKYLPQDRLDRKYRK